MRGRAMGQTERRAKRHRDHRRQNRPDVHEQKPRRWGEPHGDGQRGKCADDIRLAQGTPARVAIPLRAARRPPRSRQVRARPASARAPGRRPRESSRPRCTRVPARPARTRGRASTRGSAYHASAVSPSAAVAGGIPGLRYEVSKPPAAVARPCQVTAMATTAPMRRMDQSLSAMPAATSSCASTSSASVSRPDVRKSIVQATSAAAIASAPCVLVKRTGRRRRSARRPSDHGGSHDRARKIRAGGTRQEEREHAGLSERNLRRAPDPRNATAFSGNSGAVAAAARDRSARMSAASNVSQ